MAAWSRLASPTTRPQLSLPNRLSGLSDEELHRRGLSRETLARDVCDTCEPRKDTESREGGAHHAAPPAASPPSPQRVQRIAFDREQRRQPVELMPLGELVRLDHDAMPSSQCSQARLPSLTSIARWACFLGVVLGYVMSAHAGDGGALRRTWKSRLCISGLVLKLWPRGTGECEMATFGQEVMDAAERAYRHLEKLLLGRAARI